MLYLTCTMISSVDLACYRVSHAKDWVSVNCITILNAELNRGSDKMDRTLARGLSPIQAHKPCSISLVP